jgi:hypothetical protein
VHRLLGQAGQGGLDEGVVALELARGADEHQGRLDPLEPRRRCGRRLPDAGADHPERRRQVELRAREGRRRVVEVQRRAPHLGRARQGRQAEPAPGTVEHLDAGVVAPEGADVLEERDRLRPGPGPRLRERRGADGGDVHQEGVGTHPRDRALEVGHLVGGALGEGPERVGEALRRRARRPVVETARLDDGVDRLGSQAQRLERGHLRGERPDVHLVTAPAQLQQGRHDRVQVPAGGRGVGEETGHHRSPSR